MENLIFGAFATLDGYRASEVSNVHYIERGYEDFVGKLRKLGADIALVHEPDEPERMKSVNAG